MRSAGRGAVGSVLCARAHECSDIDRQYTAHPFSGIRKITQGINAQGFEINHKRIARLMRQMGLQAIYAGPKTSIPARNPSNLRTPSLSKYSAHCLRFCSFADAFFMVAVSF